MMNTTDIKAEKDASNPNLLKKERKIRFHHFFNLSGKLVATLVTEPSPEKDGMVAVSAAFVSKSEPRAAVTRSQGRVEALKKLYAGEVISLDLDILRNEIRNRTILERFRGGKRYRSETTASPDRSPERTLRAPRPFFDDSLFDNPLFEDSDDLPF